MCRINIIYAYYVLNRPTKVCHVPNIKLNKPNAITMQLSIFVCNRHTDTRSLAQCVYDIDIHIKCFIDNDINNDIISHTHTSIHTYMRIIPCINDIYTRSLYSNKHEK